MSNQRPRRRRNRRPASEAATTNESAPAESESGPGGGRRRSSDRGKPQQRSGSIFGIPRMSFALMAGLLVAMIAVFAMQLIFPPEDVVSVEGVVTFPDQGRRHLDDGELFSGYNSDPPTSGPQIAEGPEARVYRVGDEVVPAPAEMLPLLERGGIVIYYDPDEHQTGEAANDLLTSIESQRSFADRLAAVPIEGLAGSRDDGATIVAAAWRTHLAIPAWDADGQDQLRAFLLLAPDGYYNRFILDRGDSSVLATGGGE